MTKFSVLPTDDRWKSLTDEQIEFILYSMERDVIEEDRRRRGIQVDGEFEDYDESWWNLPHDDFEPLKAEHDEEDIARQVEAMTTEEDKAKLRARFKDNQELEGMEDLYNAEVEDVLQANLDALFKEARERESGASKAPLEGNVPTEVPSAKLDTEALNRALELMEDEGGLYEDDYI